MFKELIKSVASIFFSAYVPRVVSQQFAGTQVISLQLAVGSVGEGGTRDNAQE